MMNFKAIGKAFRHSCDGLRAALGERAFAQELAVIVPLSVVAWFLPVSLFQRAVLVAVLILILMVELLNSAIEANTDHISTEQHPLAKRAKDLGSAAVLLAMLLAGIVWAAVLWKAFA